MKEIRAEDKTVRQVLDKVKYVVDYFQREYRWERKHVEQLIDDLTTRFLSNYKETHSRKDVQNYERYYLGPIVVSIKKDGRSIIDGQQRLTTLTLLLIYLNNLQKNREDNVNVTDLIFSEKYGEKSFNLDVFERRECIDALYNGLDYDPTGKGESVQNIVERYRDIEELFPDELKGKALPYFIDWLIDNVIFVEIVTYSDDDAYTIFETMNDRGLNLTPSEMLKGYIISNLSNDAQKQEVDKIWRKTITKLREISKEEDLEFFKAWLRAKYAETIRPGKKGAANEDFEKIGTRFHQWVRDNRKKIGLITSVDFYNFVKQDMVFFAGLYSKIYGASKKLEKDLESIYHVNYLGLAPSIFYTLLMSPIILQDSQEITKKKLAIVSRFLEMFVVFRFVNYKSCAHSTIRYTMYSLVKEIRNKNVDELSEILKQKINEISEKLDGIKEFGMHAQNKRVVRFLLARMTSYIEERCRFSNRFEEYVSKMYQIEHILPDKFEDYKDEFEQRDEFEKWRNKLGATVLLPEGFNQSYGDLPYEKKLPHYFGQNLLAKSLHPQCYEKNPKFLKHVNDFNLPFKPHEQFKKKDIEERQLLYQKLLEQIYELKTFDEIVKR